MTHMPRVGFAPRGGGAHIGFSVMGEGPAVVGWPGGTINTSATLDEPRVARVARRIAEGGTRVSLDRRGMGSSDPLAPGEPPTLESQMGDVLCVLDYLKYERATLWGNAFDAQAIMRFAATYPGRVDKLLLTSTTPCPATRDDWPWGIPPEVPAALGEEFRHPGEGLGLEDLVMAQLLTPSNPADLAFWAWMSDGGRQAPSVARAYLEVAMSADVRADLPLIQAPTLIIHNTHDRFLPVESARFMAEQIPGARLEEFDSADNIVVTTDLEAKLELITEFLGDAGRSRAQRRLLTVLFTDVVGSTQRLAGTHDRTWTTLLDQIDATVEREVRRNEGRVCKSMGDGHLAIFERPSDAIEAALAIGRSLHAAGVEIRAGVHIGEVEVRGDDVAGVAVHIGARVSGHAVAGEVLITRTVADLIAGSPFAAVPAGDVELKGLPGTWPLLRVVANT